MRRALAYLSAINFLFILFLALSGIAVGVLGDLLYYLAFIIPIGVTHFVKNRLGLRYEPPRVKISGEGIRATLAFAAPSLALVFLISYLTTLVLSCFGEGGAVDVSGNLITVILSKAALTAILEEWLFRYIPISLLKGYSRRGAILYSAIFFSLVHCNIYQLPYAFAAGALFALLDLAFDSILPSVILHFLNNLVSIFWIRYSFDTTFSHIYVAALILLVAISLPVIFMLRKKLAERVGALFRDDGKVPLSVEAILFAALTILIAFIAV